MLGGLGSSFLWPLSIRTPYRYILTRQSCPHSSSLLLAVSHLIGLRDYDLFVVLCPKAQSPLWRLDCRVSVHRIGRLHSLFRRRISGILDFSESDMIGRDASILSLEEKSLEFCTSANRSQTKGLFALNHPRRRKNNGRLSTAIKI